MKYITSMVIWFMCACSSPQSVASDDSSDTDMASPVQGGTDDNLVYFYQGAAVNILRLGGRLS